ncbi:glucose-1-phosphate adenylyltransferase [Desulfogranum marinum]|uniref:glucose-1-phosphate adenylyltransferase n=1 Tax=Desulfogranum marinum TaxID=453220 RepID=UPI00196520FD|nr:glucose-1-phosphate adenylyltransferase [Desulfogranum marinum]MBM9512128.1 glucose-1-phosphate adenylyltransferase [Desulfogranum marinum]
MQSKTLTFILAGGVGSRLFPLTSKRSKPSVPFGGKYRIIDFALANCLHSGLRRILVLTQYKSHSLNKHLRDGWSIYNPELGEYVTAVPAQMNRGDHWYQGTADAICQNLNLLERSDAQYTLILSGDHIYRMDYEALLKSHKERGADVTLACMEVSVEKATAFGVIVANKNLQVVEFEEKPKIPTPLHDDPQKCLASMGVYVFSTELLKNVLTADQQDKNSKHDFGRDIIPKLLKEYSVQAYKFGKKKGRVTPDRYWRDVGTIDAYYQANMDLLKPIPPMNLYQQDWPIRTYQPQSPPARTIPGSSGTKDVFVNSMLANGVVISGGTVLHSILFHDIYIDDKASIAKSILFDGVHVGAGAKLRNCIVDKNVQIPAMEQIGYNLEQDQQRFTVSENGIVVVPEGYTF